MAPPPQQQPTPLISELSNMPIQTTTYTVKSDKTYTKTKDSGCTYTAAGEFVCGQGSADGIAIILKRKQ